MQGEEIMFPLLEKLHISHCEKLTALPGQRTFPKLQKTNIFRCPELTTVAESPKLSELNVEGREAELFLWVGKHMTSLTKLTLRSLGDSTETTSLAAKHGLREVVNGKKKGNSRDFPLAVLILIDFKSGVTEMCACFVQLHFLSISSSDALVHWPEKEFQALVSLRMLVIVNCDNLTGYAQASAELSTSSKTSQLLPRLKSLSINRCENLVEVFHYPASLRKMDICNCSKLQSTFGMRLLLGQSASSILQGSSTILEVSSSSSPRAGAEHLEELELEYCDGLTGILHLPQSLKDLTIVGCNGLTSLESRSGVLPLLESLSLDKCNTLSSLPDGPQAYSSVNYLSISNCPELKTLPESLQQRLGIIRFVDIDAKYHEDKPRPILLKLPSVEIRAMVTESWEYQCGSCDPELSQHI